jgi:hypothetical protein
MGILTHRIEDDAPVPLDGETETEFRQRRVRRIVERSIEKDRNPDQVFETLRGWSSRRSPEDSGIRSHDAWFGLGPIIRTGDPENRT